MDIIYQTAMSLPGTLFCIVLWFAVCGGVLFLGHLLLTMPMRRAERARLFLDLIESAIKQGRPVEETMISVAQSRDMSMGPRFHVVAAWLEQNLNISDAVAKVPQFLPPQVAAMLRTGQKAGDLRKVLPACRQLLKDAVSQTRAAISYLVILTSVITPLGIWVAFVLKAAVLPKFMEIYEGSMFGGSARDGVFWGIEFLLDHAGLLIGIQIILLILLWLAALVHVRGPRMAAWVPGCFRLPWRHKRLQRDFSTMLAILLDSGIPEPEAVTLAADCTANNVFRRRAARAVDGLKQGLKLDRAVQSMDDSGEFGWRLTNAMHGRGGFFKALAGWHESLDAKAFQEEQAAAHVITTALVVWSGVFVGAIVISAFGVLVSFTNMAVLW
jgi:type II secretory pathway component PulF